MKLKSIAIVVIFIASVAAKSVSSSDSELREKLIDLHAAPAC